MARRDKWEAGAAEQLDEAQVHLTLSQNNTVKEILGALPVQSPLPSRVWLSALIVQVLLFVGLCVAGGMAYAEFVRLREEVTRQREVTQRWLSQSAALAEGTQALKAETQDLRQYLSSSAAEDLLFLKIMVTKPKIDPALAQAIARHVHHYAELHGRDPNLVLAIITVESDFNPKAVSNVGALGLMQVMPQWKKVLGITGDLADPETSIKYGLQVLGFYLEMYKDVEMALTAYNRGPGQVDSALMRGRDPKNGYPARVLAAYDKLKRLSARTVLQ